GMAGGQGALLPAIALRAGVGGLVGWLARVLGALQRRGGQPAGESVEPWTVGWHVGPVAWALRSCSLALLRKSSQEIPRPRSRRCCNGALRIGTAAIWRASCATTTRTR